MYFVLEPYPIISVFSSNKLLCLRCLLGAGPCMLYNYSSHAYVIEEDRQIVYNNTSCFVGRAQEKSMEAVIKACDS